MYGTTIIRIALFLIIRLERALEKGTRAVAVAIEKADRQEERLHQEYLRSRDRLGVVRTRLSAQARQAEAMRKKLKLDS